VGLALTAWRVLRCNPFNAGGYEPGDPLVAALLGAPPRE
jgi:putative component of membrane protein insertase Oxa1/YidC/SpoIIIJ protein YidD